MGLPTPLTDSAAIIAADTSTVINLNATGCAQEIIQAIPNKVVVLDAVASELHEGRRRGRRDADLLGELVTARVIEVVELDDHSGIHFEKLVVGAAAMTLDDGEAATIAYAVSHQGIALIDERKATRLCAEMYPALQVGCTVDILAHISVRRTLGKEKLSSAVFNALRDGRMRVLPQHLKWVVDLIGADRAAECSSLPSSVRKPQRGVTGSIRARQK
jgi:predicted nucleic acid-binding protein